MRITEKEALVWLNYLYIDNKKILQLVEYFGDISEVFYASRAVIEKSGILQKNKIDSVLMYRDHDRLKKIFEEYRKFGAKIVALNEDDYPVRLKNIPDAPVVLYMKGDIIPHDEISVAVVGSRKATAYGKEAAEYLVGELTKLGITIISGMAYGIDAIAHEVALKNNARTIAVLGTGINIVYPKKNQHLYDRIPLTGAVISEFPANTEGKAYNFPRRNRIISGLSQGVLVIEAGEKSGSLITASFAGEQGRDVFAVPGNLNNVYSRGTNKLIQDGAKLVMNVDDILEEVACFKKFISDASEQTDFNLTVGECTVLASIQSGFDTVDAIVSETSMNISEVQTAITMLELSDIISSTGSGSYIINIKKGM